MAHRPAIRGLSRSLRTTRNNCCNIAGRQSSRVFALSVPATMPPLVLALGPPAYALNVSPSELLDRTTPRLTGVDIGPDKCLQRNAPGFPLNFSPAGANVAEIRCDETSSVPGPRPTAMIASTNPQRGLIVRQTPETRACITRVTSRSLRPPDLPTSCSRQPATMQPSCYFYAADSRLGLKPSEVSLEAPPRA
jgi:hypothetical protein